ncbi:hypothetical protein FYK61_09025 [Xanthomonas citri]|nr:hypothetical protein FYK61_09025 [Xanthomonas citri]
MQSIALFATRPPPTLRVGRHATTRSRAASPDVAGPPAANRRFPLYRE